VVLFFIIRWETVYSIHQLAKEYLPFLKETAVVSPGLESEQKSLTRGCLEYIRSAEFNTDSDAQDETTVLATGADNQLRAKHPIGF